MIYIKFQVNLNVRPYKLDLFPYTKKKYFDAKPDRGATLPYVPSESMTDISVYTIPRSCALISFASAIYRSKPAEFIVARFGIRALEDNFLNFNIVLSSLWLLLFVIPIV